MDEHNKVFNKHKRVLWGWWKKTSEPDWAKQLHSISQETDFEVVFVNRNTVKQYKSIVDKIHFSEGKFKAQRKLVPMYYRKEIRKIHVWFELKCPIFEVDFDEELAEVFGLNTIIFLDDLHKDVQGETSTLIVEDKQNIAPVLIHVSDLHFGPGDHNFLIPPSVAGIGGPQVTLAEALKNDFKSTGRQAGLLILSGDITSKAHWDPTFRDRVVEQVKEIAEGFGLESEKTILCPGNHDVNRESKKKDAKDIAVEYAVNYSHEENFRTFFHELTGRNRRDPLCACLTYASEGFSFVIGVLNSASLAQSEFAEYGYVGGDALKYVLRHMEEAEGKCLRILILHHHLVPVSSVELPGSGGVSLTIDAHQILEKAQASGVQLVIHGHQHHPKVIKFSQALVQNGQYGGLDQDLFILAGGSAGSNILEENISNVYNIITVEHDHVKVECRRLSNKGDELSPHFCLRLPIIPKTL